ncbi:MAG TPA: Ig-like domain-containing protein [Micromonosporaceae bacterium]|nr:Ig-like domain-containing protein [Micromonosporaceae bacterium]
MHDKSAKFAFGEGGRMAVNRVGVKVLAAALAVSVPVVLAACTGPSRPTSATTAAKAKAAIAATVPMITVAPTATGSRVPISVEIGTSVSNGIVSDVSLVSASGQHVPGTMRADGSSWVPNSPLQYAQRYTAVVTAIGADGKTTSATTSFTTVAKPVAKSIQAQVNLGDGQQYGVAMPIVVDFTASIPAAARADVQRRLFVNSMPAQVGAWRWISDREVVYRPRSYWKPGTVLTFTGALGGVPVGNRVLSKNVTSTATIGRDMEMTVTNSNHTMTITSNGKVIKRAPISMGKASTPSWSGRFVIMDRLYATVFDTLDMGPGGYRVAVNYAERLTWSGMFLHSAPWSVYAQGHFNVSHGCVNIGPSNAKWIYQNSLVGDPVTVTGTSKHVAAGNGWTAWDMSWTDYIKDSLVPITVSAPGTLAPGL